MDRCVTASHNDMLTEIDGSFRSYVLRLYVAGTTRYSTRAIVAVRRMCSEFPAFHFDLQIIDIYQRPQSAVDDQIVAVPTLVRQRPLPVIRFVGDMSNSQRLFERLGLCS